MNKNNKKVLIEITPDNRSCSVDAGTSLKSILEQVAVDLVYPCGSNASCGKCAVQFEKGAPAANYSDTIFFTPEQLKQGFRLACNCIVTAPGRIRIPEETRTGETIFLTRAKKRIEKVDPIIEKHYLKVTPPSLSNLKSDEDLVEEVLTKHTKNTIHFSHYCLKRVSETLRKNQFELTATLGEEELLEVEAGDTTNKMFGIAVDIGTTTLVVSIHDLVSGKTLGIEAAMNPNIKYGDDLISRISFISDDRKNLQILQNMLIGQINSLIGKIRRRAKIARKNIYSMTVAGNAVMNHLFFGVNPKNIALAPYTPVYKKPKRTQSGLLKLATHPQALVYILPNLGGFVGGDIVADMLVAGFGMNTDKIRLLIDIGTNCEVVLEKNGTCLAVSSPAGPALEGAGIKYGMRAEVGAIYDIRLDEDNFKLQTIKKQPARGICGSGLFHLVEAFNSKGLINNDGTITDAEQISDPNIKTLFNKRITTVDGTKAIELADKPKDIHLTQKDIRAFQLARSAIVSAWDILCKELSCTPEEIEEVYIAGAFGNYIRPDTALRLGLVPDVGLEHIHFIGNAALEGARMVLLNRRNMQFITKLIKKTKFMELGGRADFQESFIMNLYLP
jgi:uncharacterized 2Fe-2S/4Fe-4S cluster protein (DUF4445 family)